MGYGRIQNPSFLTPPAPLAESDAAEVQEANVVILGAGNAGCAAAASCADHGLQAIVLEKLETVQGRGGGIGLCNTKFTKAYGESIGQDLMVDIPKAQHLWVRSCGSRVNEALVSLWFNKSAEAGNWLDRQVRRSSAWCRCLVPRTTRRRPSSPSRYDVPPCSHNDRRPRRSAPSECGYFAGDERAVRGQRRTPPSTSSPATYLFQHHGDRSCWWKDGQRDRRVRHRQVTARSCGCSSATKGVVLATGGIHEDTGDGRLLLRRERARACCACQSTAARASPRATAIKMGLWARRRTCRTARSR